MQTVIILLPDAETCYEYEISLKYATELACVCSKYGCYVIHKMIKELTASEVPQGPLGYDKPELVLIPPFLTTAPFVQALKHFHSSLKVSSDPGRQEAKTKPTSMFPNQYATIAALNIDLCYDGIQYQVHREQSWLMMSSSKKKPLSSCCWATSVIENVRFFNTFEEWVSWFVKLADDRFATPKEYQWGRLSVFIDKCAEMFGAWKACYARLLIVGSSNPRSCREVDFTLISLSDYHHHGKSSQVLSLDENCSQPSPTHYIENGASFVSAIFADSMAFDVSFAAFSFITFACMAAAVYLVIRLTYMAVEVIMVYHFPSSLFLWLFLWED